MQNNTSLPNELFMKLNNQEHGLHRDIDKSLWEAVMILSRQMQKSEMDRLQNKHSRSSFNNHDYLVDSKWATRSSSLLISYIAAASECVNWEMSEWALHAGKLPSLDSLVLVESSIVRMMVLKILFKSG